MRQKVTFMVLAGVALIISSLRLWAAPPPPNEAQCKSRWTLVSAQSLSFGAFSIETGSGTLQINSSGVLTTTGAITTVSTSPVSTFTVTITNTKDPAVCGTYPFDLSWGIAPAPLTGPGAAMPLTNVLVSEPSLIPTPTALPILGLTTASLPITLTFQAELTATFPQASGLYTSPAFTLDLTQGGSTTSISSTATVTSVSPLSITEVLSMDFGTVAGGSGTGAVVMDTTGTRSIIGDGQIIATGPGTAATFLVTGEPSQSYALSVIGPAILENASGQQITATAFTYNSSGVLPVGGSDMIQIGATLNLGPLQAAGIYQTTIGGGKPYLVTINYN